MLVSLPLSPQDFPSAVTYRFNVFAIAAQLGLDVERLEIYRLAVKAGFYTDYPQEQSDGN